MTVHLVAMAAGLSAAALVDRWLVLPILRRWHR